MITRVQIGPKVVASDDARASSLDVENSLSRNTAVIYPFRDRLRRNTDRTRKAGLGAQDAENGLKNASAHDESNLIHGQFMYVNRCVIDRKPLVDEHLGMANQIPQPENYGSFAAWVRALADFAGSQAALARAVTVKPQMITKYLNGRSIEPENLQKFADYSGTSYAKLRMLVDGKPASDAKNIKDRINQTGTPMGAQIGRKWEAIQDERTRNLIVQQIDNAIEQQNRLETLSRKRTG
jgi:hypothetical protein